MSTVFADTFYWITLTNPNDASHQTALALTRSLGSPTIVTTEPVLIEYLDFFASWGETFRRKAAKNIRDIVAGPSVRVAWHTREDFQTGLALYADRPDKGYSLTDCISMQTMRREGLTEVLTNDHHFEQEGFRTLFRQ